MMRIIDSNKINFESLKQAIAKPELYEKSTDRFWDDPYISQQMLDLHLNPEIESASKTKETIEKETSFIIQVTEMDKNKTVIDLGCGPGLYVREFAKTGAKITGVDISKNSLQYAVKNIQSDYENTEFKKMNYMDMDYQESFDIATMIFYDFSVLSEDEQSILLSRIHRALRKDGLFVLDVVTENRKPDLDERISVYESSFWSSKPHMEVFKVFMYENPKTEGHQYTIIDEEGYIRIIRFYNRLFNLDDITVLFKRHNFIIEKVYKNLMGEPLCGNSETFGIFARKI